MYRSLLKSVGCNDDRGQIGNSNFKTFSRKKNFHFYGIFKVKKILESCVQKKSMKSISCNDDWGQIGNSNFKILASKRNFAFTWDFGGKQNLGILCTGVDEINKL